MHQRWSTVNAVWFVVKNVSTRQNPGGLAVCKAVAASKQDRCFFFQTEARLSGATVGPVRFAMPTRDPHLECEPKKLLKLS